MTVRKHLLALLRRELKPSGYIISYVQLFIVAIDLTEKSSFSPRNGRADWHASVIDWMAKELSREDAVSVGSFFII